jgi:cyclohexyl-isocyanide hydratase
MSAKWWRVNLARSTQETAMTLQIGILIFPRVQQLDLTGPYEVFASMPAANVHLVWKDRSAITSATGLVLAPTMTFAECPTLDVLCIPGGGGVNALLEDAEVLDFVRAQAARARYVTSVCSGSLVLGAAGLLRGRRATTHWLSHDFLAKFGAIPVHGRVVRDGNLITAGGVTAGIDFGLAVVAELAGQAQAEAIQLALEYAPQPPFRAGTPDEAPPAVLAAVRKQMAPTRAAREAIIGVLVGAGAAKAP